ncbi:tetratricopeptide repeat-containing protein [Candidatus Symbiothrix dinenymphae]|nr:tetratricopeptide repeat-containing protein [Candidatus Symbiothrix dinenymphae]
MKTNILIIIGCLLVTGNWSLLTAQKQVRKDLRTGNSAYQDKKFTDAEVAYRRAIENNARSSEAAYNLGNALLRQDKAQEAVEQYQLAIGNEKDKNKVAMAWHNTGNVFLANATEQKEGAAQDPDALKKSIEAYKKALRNNPRDDETRYNLALAQHLQKKQEGGGGNDDKDDQKKDDQKQEEQKQEQQQQQEQKQEEKPQEQPQNPNQMSKESADQILDAMMQNEKETQDKVKEQQMKQQKQRKREKNW